MFVELGVQTSLTVRDKDWVGNWWLGFAIFGAICVFWSIWLLGFPKEFPLTKKRRERTEITTYADKVRFMEVIFYKGQDKKQVRFNNNYMQFAP